MVHRDHPEAASDRLVCRKSQKTPCLMRRPNGNAPMQLQAHIQIRNPTHIHSMLSNTLMARAPSFSNTLTTLSPSIFSSSSARPATCSIQSCTVICFSSSDTSAPFCKKDSAGVDWSTISMSIGCHCAVCSIREGDCSEAGGGGRSDAGRVEGGAFSMSDVEGEGG
jgi:hypothetical protein